MSHEARINDALKQLGEEYRLGMVQVVEYRSRRKMLLESWGERDVTTSPRALRAKTPAISAARKPAAVAPPKKSAAPFVIAAVALVALAAGAWFLLGSGGKAGQANSTNQPGMTPLSAEALTVRKAADDFMVRNVWDADSINAFLKQWRSLSDADRARVGDEPVMRTLRFRLDQNIQAEMQLITPETKPEERVQLTLLQDFLHALTGEAQ